MPTKHSYSFTLSAAVIVCGAGVGFFAISGLQSLKVVSDFIEPLILVYAHDDPATHRNAVRTELDEAIMYFRQNTCDAEERKIVALKLEQYIDARNAEQVTFFRPWGKSERELDILWGTPQDLELKRAIHSFVQGGFLAIEDFSRYRAIFGLRKRKGEWWRKHRCYQ